jgi:hypothetical protein
MAMRGDCSALRPQGRWMSGCVTASSRRRGAIRWRCSSCRRACWAARVCWAGRVCRVSRGGLTLKNTLDWSFALLSSGEQALFARMGVFVGTFGLAAVEAVYGETGAPGQAEPRGLAIDALNSLVGSSLVQSRTRGEEPRFRLLETIREYALERLRNSGAWQEAHDRHAAYFAGLATAAESELGGEGQLAWLSRLETEAGNLSAALSWLMDQDRLDEAIAFMWRTWRFWLLRGHLDDVTRHAETFLARGGEMAPHERAMALSGTGFTLISDGDQDKGRSAFEQSLPLFREAGDPLGGALAAAGLGHVLGAQNDPKRGGELLEYAMSLLREADTGELTAEERVYHLLDVAWPIISSARSSSVTQNSTARPSCSRPGWTRLAARRTGSRSSSRCTTWRSAARRGATWTVPPNCSGKGSRWRARPATSRRPPTTSRRWPPLRGSATTRSAPPACWQPPTRSCRRAAAVGCTPTCRAPRMTAPSWPSYAPGSATRPTSRPRPTAGPSQERAPSSTGLRMRSQGKNGGKPPLSAAATAPPLPCPPSRTGPLLPSPPPRMWDHSEHGPSRRPRGPGPRAGQH